MNTNLNDLHTVKPPIRGQPPYNGQTACPLPLTVHTFLPQNNGQNARPQRVHYLEVPLYTCVHGILYITSIKIIS